MLRAAILQSPIRVLLADSSRMGNQLLSNVFSRDRRFKLIGQALTSIEILNAVAAGCDVLVVAANLEREGGGIEITRRLRHLQPGMNVVVLLDELRCEDVVAAFRSGAKGVFGRTQSPKQLWKCIACVQAGQIWAGSQELQFLLEALQQSMAAHINGPEGISLLSEQEQRVVRHVCEGLSNREIAERMGLSEHTIKNHLFRIYARLGISSRVEIMFSALNQSVARAPQATEQEPLSDADLLHTYLKEAEHSPVAQLVVGKMYLEGRGTKKDLLAGYMWLSLAEQTSRELLNDCSSAKNQVAAQMKEEEKAEAENCARARLQPSRAQPMSAPPPMSQQPGVRPVSPKRRPRSHDRLRVRPLSNMSERPDQLV